MTFVNIDFYMFIGLYIISILIFGLLQTQKVIIYNFIIYLENNIQSFLIYIAINTKRHDLFMYLKVMNLFK
jgi:hypothetical protein